MTQEQKTLSSGTSGPSGSSSTTTSTPKSTSNLSSKLSKDGKLTPQEQQCCFDQTLCFFCGRQVMKDCPKSTAAKARAANAMENSNSEATVTESKKLGSNPPAPASDQGCIDHISASVELHLNVSALSSPHSLILSLTSDLVPSTPIQTLVDSGSTHCFLDSAFTSIHTLCTTPIPPMPLRPFDGSTNFVINSTINLTICFPSGEIQSLTFYVTPLDVSCSAS
jgi:hypothetical protein